MKTLSEYIVERGAAPMAPYKVMPRFICGMTKSKIDNKDIIDYAENDPESLAKIFKKLSNGAYGKKYVIRTCSQKSDKEVMVDTENNYAWDFHGKVIYNTDDKREAYEETTLSKEKNIAGIIIMRE